MTPTVHIFVSCRRPELQPLSLLVFRSLRVGFPTAPVVIHLNPSACDASTVSACQRIGREIGATVIGSSAHQHDEWIEDRLKSERDPIAIVDTDMVFYESVEGWQFRHPIAGAYEPRHLNPVTKVVHWDRLHTSLLFVRPQDLRERIAGWTWRLPRLPFKIQTSLFRQQWLVMAGHLVLADTNCLLYQATGGDAFTPEQRDAYSHLHCGTWSDVAGVSIPGLKDLHARTLQDPEAARGCWRKFEEWYTANPGS